MSAWEVLAAVWPWLVVIAILLAAGVVLLLFGWVLWSVARAVFASEPPEGEVIIRGRADGD